MNYELAATYARQPDFYNGTFCIKCKKHYPLIEFVWKGSRDVVGS